MFSEGENMRRPFDYKGVEEGPKKPRYTRPRNGSSVRVETEGKFMAAALAPPSLPTSGQQANSTALTGHEERAESIVRPSYSKLVVN